MGLKAISGAELVELSERFYRGIFVWVILFVGMAALAALVLLPRIMTRWPYVKISQHGMSLLVTSPNQSAPCLLHADAGGGARSRRPEVL